MIYMSAYICMGRLHVTAAHWGKQPDGRTLVTQLGVGEATVDPAAEMGDEELLHLMCEVGLDIACDTWATREPF